jgi:hypothetical protein
VWLLLVTLKYGLSSFHCRSIMKMMSSAFMSRVGVKLLLLCHFTPRRRLKVYSLPSGDTVHRSARPGTTCVPPLSKSTSRL